MLCHHSVPQCFCHFSFTMKVSCFVCMVEYVQLYLNAYFPLHRSFNELKCIPQLLDVESGARVLTFVHDRIFNKAEPTIFHAGGLHTLL